MGGLYDETWRMGEQWRTRANEEEMENVATGNSARKVRKKKWKEQKTKINEYIQDQPHS